MLELSLHCNFRYLLLKQAYGRFYSSFFNAVEKVRQPNIHFTIRFLFQFCKLLQSSDAICHNKCINIKSCHCQLGTMTSMDFRAAIYMSFKKTQCSLSFIVINVIIINFDGTSK
jgi:hypothetical protein